MGRWSRPLLVLVVAFAAGAAAYYASRTALEHEPASPPAAPVVRPANVIPEARPEVSLADRDGKPRRLTEWNGRPQVINFWATWCAPCRREIPMLNALAKDPDLKDFAVIGIAIDFREDVLRFLEATPIDYTVLIGEEDGLDAARAFGIESPVLPFTAFVDRAGHIVTIHIGELHREQANIILSVVRQLDAGQIDMKGAQARIRSKVPKIG